MKKILVIGSGGSGKSTFAKQLGKILDIKVIHLDSLYWKSGWVEPPKHEWVEVVKHLIAQDSWIIDGNYSGTLELRFEACDTVVFLDKSRLLCLWRVLKRAIVYRNKTRPDMAEGCLEKIDFEFMLWIWNYPHRTKPKIVKKLEQKPDSKNIVWLRTDAEADNYLSGLKSVI
jgi:adenylate kinase family enzyme